MREGAGVVRIFSSLHVSGEREYYLTVLPCLHRTTVLFIRNDNILLCVCSFVCLLVYRDVRNRFFIAVQFRFGFLKKNSDSVRHEFGSV